MTHIPEHRDDSKEIRLFGEKSIKEEAYRQKILELERELMKLEALVKERKRTSDLKNAIKESTTLPEYSEGIFYEAATSLDQKVKKYHHMLDHKARHLSDRLNLQAQNIIEHEKIKGHVTNTKRAIIILSSLTIMATLMAGFSVFTLYRLNSATYSQRAKVISASEGPENVRDLLQETGFYNNQYNIVSLTYFNRVYKGIVELHFKPNSNWALKMVASDILENFKRISSGRSMQLNFIYEGDTYAHMSYSPVSDETHFEFK